MYGLLWYLQVPSEAFRLGKTRVFFRAGQISTLQKILNETPPEKGPWIFSRLQEALASRQKAKAAAAEAQVGASRTQTHPVYVVTQCSSELTFFSYASTHPKFIVVRSVHCERFPSCPQTFALLPQTNL